MRDSSRRLVLVAVAAAAITAVVTGAVLFGRERDADTDGAAARDAGAFDGGTFDAAAIQPVSSRAFDHAPAGCELIALVDVAGLLATRAAQIHLAPVLGDVMTGGGAGARQATGLVDVLRAARIDLRKDVRELVLCAGWLDGPADERRIAIVAGGALRPGALMAALASRPDAGASLEHTERGVVARTKTRAGVPLLVGQAPDGAIAISSHGPYLEDALRTGAARASAYQLQEGAELSLYVTSSVFSTPIAAASPLARHKDDVIDASVALSSKAPGSLVVRAATRSPDAARALSQTLGSMLEKAKAAPPMDGGLAGRWLDGATVRLEGALVVATVPLDEARIEDAIKALSGWLRGAYDEGLDL